MAVEDGSKKLVDASIYQNAARKKKICFIGSSVIIVLVVILVGIFEPTKSIIN